MGWPYPVDWSMYQVSLRARTLHETGSWLVLTDCSNAFNTVRRTVVLAEVANCVTALMPLVAKCYGIRPADAFFRRTPGRPGRSPAPAVSSRVTPWGRQCSVWRCDQG